jgi:hypothetical protein
MLQTLLRACYRSATRTHSPPFSNPQAHGSAADCPVKRHDRSPWTGVTDPPRRTPDSASKTKIVTDFDRFKGTFSNEFDKVNVRCSMDYTFPNVMNRKLMLGNVLQ